MTVPTVSRVPALVAAQRNSAVSSPSRPTASTATTASDQRPPSAAASIWPRSSPPRPRAARAIQKIIQVTKRDRDDREAAADRLLGLEGEAARAEGQRGAEGRG